MNIYNAIMAAADFIEASPDRFNYMECAVPRIDSCGTPGCALGWIGAMCGLADPEEQFGGIGMVAGHTQYREEEAYCPVERSLLGIDQTDFYSRMGAIDSEWNMAAEPCAAALRLYAEKYHGHEKLNAGALPNWQTIAASPLIPEHVKSEELVS